MSFESQSLMSPGFPGLSFPGVGAGLAILREGKILLYRRRKAPEAGFWKILGGKVDHMEPAAEAARREAQEESGLAIQSLSFLCFSEQIIEKDRQHWLSLIYMCDDFAGEPQLAEPDKFFELGWFSASNLPQPLSRFTMDAVKTLHDTGYFARNAAS